jgi:hypothetical protein
MSDTAVSPALQAETLSRKATFWGLGHAAVAIALIVYAVANGSLSWFLLSGLIVAVLAGGVYLLASRSLKQSARAGRGKVIAASLLGLNWLLVVSCLAIFNSIMHPDETVTSGIGNLVVGFVVPLAHLIGNFWFLIAGLNLDTGEWRAG